MVIANTFGWDTVYGIRFSDVNNMLVKDYRGYENYQHTTQDGFVLSGDMKPWILTGGSGHILIMSVPGDSLTLENFPIAGSSQTRTNVVYQIEVELELIPRNLTESSAANGGQLLDLVMKVPGRSGGPEMSSQTNVVGVSWDGYDPSDPNDPDQLLATTVRLAMTDWFNGPSTDPTLPPPMESFQNVFASVNLNQRITDADTTETDPFEWLSPSAANYGVFSTTAPDGQSDGILAVMCMGKGRQDLAKDLGHTVSPALVPALKRGGFLISKDRFMENMLMPGLAHTFGNEGDAENPNWPTENFELEANGTRLRSKNVMTIDQLNIAGEDEDPLYVEATLPKGGVQLTLSDTELEVHFRNLSHPYNKGLFGWEYNAFHNITVKTFADKDEDGRFVLVPGREPEDGEAPFAFHTASLEQTDASKTRDKVLLGVDIAFFALAGFAAFKAAKAASATSKAADASVDAARAANAAQEALVTTGEGFNHAAKLQAAREAAEAVQGLAPSTIAWQKWADITGLIGLGMAGYLIGVGVAGNVSEDTIKDNSITEDNVEFFAARVMQPIQWPGATGFELESVGFNGGLHVVGNPTFTDPDPAG